MKTNCMWLSLAAGVWLSVATSALSQPPGGGRGPGGPRAGGPPRGAEMLQRLDKNEDGKLSKDEVPERLWDRLSRLDANEDGMVTKDELAKMIGQGRQARRARGNRPPATEQPSARKELNKTEKEPEKKQPPAAASRRPFADRPGPRRGARETVKEQRDRKDAKKVDKKRAEEKKESDVKRRRASRFVERSAGRRPEGRPWAGRAPGRRDGGRSGPPFASPGFGPSRKARASQRHGRCPDVDELKAAVGQAVAKQIRAYRASWMRGKGKAHRGYQHWRPASHAGPPWMVCPHCGQSYRGGPQAWRGRGGGRRRGHAMMQRPGRGPGKCPFAAGAGPMMKKHRGGGPFAQAAGPPWARMNKAQGPRAKGPRAARMDRAPRGPRAEEPGSRTKDRGGPAGKKIDRDGGPDGPRPFSPPGPPRSGSRD